MRSAEFEGITSNSRTAAAAENVARGAVGNNREIGIIFLEPVKGLVGQVGP